MGKKYLLSHHKNNGKIGNDSADLNSYFELGWELISTGLWAKCNVTSDDTVISARDRLFMYKHLTDKLVAYEDYSITGEEVDIASRHWDLTVDYNSREWSDDENQKMSQIELSDFEIPNKQFVCIQVRRRDHCDYRNGNIDIFEKTIRNISQKYPVFVVGKMNEHLSAIPNVECVNLEKYCFLIRSKKCAVSIGISSGCSMLNHLYGREGLPVFIRWTETASNIRLKHENHILFFGDKINVANVEEHIYASDDMFDKVEMLLDIHSK